jgi:hypothetical protein
VRHAPQLPAALVFIPLLAAWAIWAGLAISARVTDTRVAPPGERLITGARPSRGIPAPGTPQDIRSPGEVSSHQ